MIDLHTHTFLSDGALIPSELARRAVTAGYKAIAITDHVDHSNIKTVLPGIVEAAQVLNRYWDIQVLPGVEITHVPVEVFSELTGFAREKGARIVVAHGESPVEPVIPGTNRAAIQAGVDILAHPGYITDEDALLAREREVALELTARAGHASGNRHVLDAARRAGAKLVLNTDTHLPDDLLTREKIDGIFAALDVSEELKKEILANSAEIVARAVKQGA